MGAGFSPGDVSAWWRAVAEDLAAEGFTPVAVEVLAGDVSARRYARIRLADGERFVVCSYPGDMVDAASRFLAATALLESVAVPVPRVERHSLEAAPAWVLLEDLGPRTVCEAWTAGELTAEGLDRCLAEAAGHLRRIERLPLAAVADLGSPPLDRSLLATELSLSWERYLLPRRLVPDRALADDLRNLGEALCARLGAATPVPCHRDFMVRNLMLRASGQAGAEPTVVVIDHQDLRPGPPCYDLASLLNDSLDLSPSWRMRRLGALADDAEELALYRAAVAQRMLKIVGTFAHFAALGNERHLPLIPGALARFVEAVDGLPEGRDVAAGLRRAWAPVLREAPA